LFEGKQLEKWMNNKLKDGYNPFADAGTVFTANQPIEKQLQTIFDEQFASESKDTTNSYKEHFNRFMKFINEKNLDHLSMADITDEICDQYRNYVHKTLKLSLKTINASLSYMANFSFTAKRKNGVLQIHLMKLSVWIKNR
jgi:site-specific recombinase XerD